MTMEKYHFLLIVNINVKLYYYYILLSQKLILLNIILLKQEILYSVNMNRIQLYKTMSALGEYILHTQCRCRPNTLLDSTTISTIHCAVFQK